MVIRNDAKLPVETGPLPTSSIRFRSSKRFSRQSRGGFDHPRFDARQQMFGIDASGRCCRSGGQQDGEAHRRMLLQPAPGKVMRHVAVGFAKAFIENPACLVVASEREKGQPAFGRRLAAGGCDAPGAVFPRVVA